MVEYKITWKNAYPFLEKQAFGVSQFSFETQMRIKQMDEES